MKALIMDGEWAPRDPGSLSEESLRERIAPAREVWRNVHRTIQDVPEPRLGPNEVMVQPKVTAICGSDFLRMEDGLRGVHDSLEPMCVSHHRWTRGWRHGRRSGQERAST